MIIPSTTDSFFTWGGIPVKEVILSVAYPGYITASIEMILLEGFTKHIEGIFLLIIFNKTTIIKTNRH